ncbi:MAG: hypothetical protein SH847_16255 [Roseiflexaceae bacterium]|nr:hypothetical protein [Roseiflexaceae bacterium]
MITAELERLHALALDRRYDLRTCNPTHGRFYAFMSAYTDAANSESALLTLAATIDAYRAGSSATQELLVAYGQLAELARWRVAQLSGGVTD